MIGAVCFSLRTKKGGVIPAAHGHLLHAALFDYFRRRSPELSARLHDEMNLKPFTASMLELPPAASRGKNRIVLREGDPAIWRVTALNETVLRVLLGAASSDSGGNSHTARATWTKRTSAYCCCSPSSRISPALSG